MAKKPKVEVERYAVKLLFQFRVSVGGKSNTMRTCEERIIVLEAETAKKALVTAKRRGRSGEHSYKNHAGNKVHFEFVGVMDLLHLGVECEEDEVWYNITTMKKPKERAKSILPPEEKLNAIYWSSR
jgi:hypothetical protein